MEAMYGRPKPKPPARVPPGAAVTAAEFADLPFGGHAGEWLSGGQTTPAPPPQPLQIEPPPWAGEGADAVSAIAHTVPTERPDALATLKAEAEEWPEPPGPVEVVARALPARHAEEVARGVRDGLRPPRRRSEPGP